MNSQKLFVAFRPTTSNFVIKRYAFTPKDLIILLRKEIKSLYGPAINTKTPKRRAKLSGPSVKHGTVSTSAASSSAPDGVASKNPETNYSSEMHWILGNRWNQIDDSKPTVSKKTPRIFTRQSDKNISLNAKAIKSKKSNDTKGGNVSQTLKDRTDDDSNGNSQTSELKLVNSIGVELVNNNSASGVIQKPIPLSNEELRNVLNYPLQSDVLCESPTDIRAAELRTLPSVGRVLQYTMPEAARNALLNWKLAKISELGEQGFAELQKSNLNSGFTFHASLQQYFLTNEVPIDSSPVYKLWESVRGVLDSFTAMPASVEKTVHHPILKYKGICDCVSDVNNQLTIIEWKKSGRSKPTLNATYDAPLQLCAYLGAINCTPEFQGRIRQGMVVVAYENGDQADVYKMDEVMLRNYWRAWLKRLHEYWIRYRDDTLPEPI